MKTKTLKAECLKLKRKKIGLFTATMILVELLWLIVTAEKYLIRDYAARIADFSYNIVWDITIYNSLFLPLFTAILASRICDSEHKGSTLKLLLTTQNPRGLYWTKYLICAALLLMIAVVQAGFSYLYPLLRGCTLEIPSQFLLQQMGATFLVSCLVMSLQLTLSILLSNQVPALILGIAGSFLGMMSQLFPPVISRFIPWYYFSGTSIISSYYTDNSMNYSLHPVPAATCVVLLVLTIAISLFGMARFCKKEV